jgi:hypothetical protein
MKRLLRMALWSGAMMAGVCLANEPDICSSLCAAEKRDCRAEAQKATIDDTDPPFLMGESNRVARDFSEVRLHAQEARVRDVQNFRDRRMERVQTCDATYLKCSNACASQRAAPGPSSILLRPEKAQ